MTVIPLRPLDKGVTPLLADRAAGRARTPGSSYVRSRYAHAPRLYAGRNQARRFRIR